MNENAQQVDVVDLASCLKLQQFEETQFGELKYLLQQRYHDTSHFQMGVFQPRSEGSTDQFPLQLKYYADALANSHSLQF